MEQTTNKIPEALKVITDDLLEDKLPGSYYHTWQANIALQFKDEFDRQFPHSSTGWLFDINSVANKAAQNFLELLIYQTDVGSNTNTETV